MKIPTGSNNKYNVTNLAGDSNRALENTTEDGSIFRNNQVIVIGHWKILMETTRNN